MGRAEHADERIKHVLTAPVCLFVCLFSLCEAPFVLSFFSWLAGSVLFPEEGRVARAVLVWTIPRLRSPTSRLHMCAPRGVRRKRQRLPFRTQKHAPLTSRARREGGTDCCCFREGGAADAMRCGGTEVYLCFAGEDGWRVWRVKGRGGEGRENGIR